MDLERIKQNLRLRSGRSRKPRKEPRIPKVPEPTVTPVQPATPKSELVNETPQSVEDRASREPNGETNGGIDGEVNGKGLKGQEQEQEKEQEQEQEEGPEPESAPQQATEPGSPQETPDDNREDSSTFAQTVPDIEGENLVTDMEEEDKAPGEEDSPPAESHEKTNDQDSKQNDDQLYPTDANASLESLDFDLKPPAFKPKPPSVESLAELLFSAQHFNTILHHPPFLARFTTFLHRYRPKDYPTLTRYIEASKAIAAIEYASAVAEAVPRLPEETEQPQAAVSVAESFQNLCAAAFNSLVDTVLPMYITYNLVKVVSECLTNDIAGRSTPMMRDLVAGLSEIFCLTDPNQEDNPIIYASEEFYRLTGYGRDDVIGHNCRFLQGPKTKRESPARLKESLEKGEETCETLLNYRRDGRPFINLLMIAPLHDHKGNVRYNIGAQVDVSGLVLGGRALEGFQRLLQQQKEDEKRGKEKSKAAPETEESRSKKRALAKLRELSELFDMEESAVVQSHSRSSSVNGEEDTRSMRSSKIRTPRKLLFDTDMSDEDDEEQDTADSANDWTLGQGGPKGLSGKLPGIYEKYMLIRAAPSLRIVFVSPKLRPYGNIVQSPFLSHVAAPKSTLVGLRQSFNGGNPVSARINFMDSRGESRDGTRVEPNAKHEHGKYGRACWIAATPLLGGDDQIGVWMIVFVEKTQGMGQTRGRAQTYQSPAQVSEEEPSKSKGIQSPMQEERATLSVKKEALTPQHQQNGKIPDKPKEFDSSTKQRSTAAYRHVAAPSIDEYQSEVEESEDGAIPQSPTYAITGEEYVRPRMPRTMTNLSTRVLIDPDSDVDDDESIRDGFESSHQDFTSSRSLSQSPTSGEARSSHSEDFIKSPPQQDEREPTPPVENHDQQERTIPPADYDEQELTPPAEDHDHQKTISRAEDYDESETTPSAEDHDQQSAHGGHISHGIPPSPSSQNDSAIGMQGREKHGSVRSSMGYMDLLRQSNTEIHSSAHYERRGRPRLRLEPDEETNEYSDPDCERSPYSVD